MGTYIYRLINSIVTLITDQVHLNTNHVLFHDMKGELHKFITCEIKKFISRWYYGTNVIIVIECSTIKKLLCNK
jgi:hypothetical protein